MLPQKLAFVDIETTGTRSSFDRVIEIGIIRVEDNKIVRTFDTLINPQTHVPSEIEALTGIRASDLESAPTFREVAQEILETLEGAFFVAHNVRFDYSFLKYEFKRREISFSPKHFCTVKLSRALFPTVRHHNLDSLIKRFQIKCEKRHRALADAQVLVAFYQKIQSLFPLEKIAEAINLGLKRPTIPLSLTLPDLESLPELPGVYMFYGEDDAPLYIGKSINMRNRVLSHFSGDVHSPLDWKISQQIKRIETITTAGELGALFLESDLIKRLMPLYNRKLRTKKQLVSLRAKKNTNWYDTVSFETMEGKALSDLYPFCRHSGKGRMTASRISHIGDAERSWTRRVPDGNPSSQDDEKCYECEQEGVIVGFFKSVKTAKDYLYQMAKEHGLCEKLLGLEKTKGPCFGYRLGRCKGACVGLEKPLFYNLRFAGAFSKERLASWPFPGPVLIEERDPLSGKTDNLIVDKWCFLGKVAADENGSLNDLTRNYSFDLDMYKILRRYLRSPKNVKKIKLLNGNLLDSFSGERLRSQYREEVT